VLAFDRDNKKISLGYKKNEDNPWTRFTTQHKVGDVVNVKIVKMMPFGAFAEICPGVDGLIHISQVTDHRIGLPSEVLSDGQLVDVKITEIDNDRKKVSLSIRALIEPASQPLSEKDIAEAVVVDKAPVIVYDTDAPPPEDDFETEDQKTEPLEKVVEKEEKIQVKDSKAQVQDEAPETSEATAPAKPPKAAKAAEVVETPEDSDAPAIAEEPIEPDEDQETGLPATKAK